MSGVNIYLCRLVFTDEVRAIGESDPCLERNKKILLVCPICACNSKCTLKKVLRREESL